MSRVAIACLAVGLGCGRAQGVDDKDLGNLVVAPAVSTEAIVVTRAATEPAELSRAMMQPYGAVSAALGAHRTEMTVVTRVEEAAQVTTDMTETTVLELGDKDAYHGTYGNTADYGREVIFDGASLFLRPRYQRWHQRAPESPTEAVEQRDKFYAPIAATWELIAPAVDVADKGATTFAGRNARKIELRQAAKAAPNPPEKLVQRKWREARVIHDVSGEVILDAERAIPLSVKLVGTIELMRDRRNFKMTVTLTSTVTKIGAAAITPPETAEVVATPERLREVDERDKLLEGIAPPSRKQSQSEAVTP